MARQVIVVALVFVAIVGLASAQTANPPQASAAVPTSNAPQAKASAVAPSGAAAQSPSGSPGNAPAPATGPTAEPGKMPDVAMPGPVGSPEKKAEAPTNSGARALPATAAVAGIAIVGFFY